MPVEYATVSGAKGVFFTNNTTTANTTYYNNSSYDNNYIYTDEKFVPYSPTEEIEHDPPALWDQI